MSARAGAWAIVGAVLVAASAAASEAPVRLVLSLHLEEGPRDRECALGIADARTILHLLDEATSADCIASWRYSPGEKVDCIDDRCGIDGWSVYVNGAPIEERLHERGVSPGDRVEMVLDDVASILNLG